MHSDMPDHRKMNVICLQHEQCVYGLHAVGVTDAVCLQISAGIRTVLRVELQAMTHGKVAYDIEIQMDTHTLFLPVSANIL